MAPWRGSRRACVNWAQRGQLFRVGAGVAGASASALYFALRCEPGRWRSMLRWRWRLLALAPCAWRLGRVSGCQCCWSRCWWRRASAWRVCARHLVAEPVLGFRYYGPVEGRIVNIDRSVSDAMRLTLDAWCCRRVAPARTPARVRVSLHGDSGLCRARTGSDGDADRRICRRRRARWNRAASISAAWPGSTGWARSATPAAPVLAVARAEQGGSRAAHPPAADAHLGRRSRRRCRARRAPLPPRS